MSRFTNTKGARAAKSGPAQEDATWVRKELVERAPEQSHEQRVEQLLFLSYVEGKKKRASSSSATNI